MFPGDFRREMDLTGDFVGRSQRTAPSGAPDHSLDERVGHPGAGPLCGWWAHSGEAANVGGRSLGWLHPDRQYGGRAWLGLCSAQRLWSTCWVTAGSMAPASPPWRDECLARAPATLVGKLAHIAVRFGGVPCGSPMKMPTRTGTPPGRVVSPAAVRHARVGRPWAGPVLTHRSASS